MMSNKQFFGCYYVYNLSFITLFSELMNNDNLREQQITGAEKFIRLLCPSERAVIDDLVCQDSRWRQFPTHTPSMLAAATILFHLKP